MMRSLKNTKLYQSIAQTFKLWRDTFSFAIDKVMSGLFGGLFMVILLVSVHAYAHAQSRSPYTRLVKGEGSPYDTAVAIEVRTYRIETTKLRLADIVIDSIAYENELLRSELLESYQVADLQELTIKAQSDQELKSDLRWSDLNNNYNQIFKLIQEKDEPEKWYRNKYLWFGVGTLSGVLIRR